MRRENFGFIMFWKPQGCVYFLLEQRTIVESRFYEHRIMKASISSFDRGRKDENIKSNELILVGWIIFKIVALDFL